ncbi:MAG: sugar phosphate isomerase/epimerase family protein [Bacteroidota bacterium]
MKSKSNRREFLQKSMISAAALTLPAAAFAGNPGAANTIAPISRKPFNMKLGFMSSMAQDKTVPELIEMAKKYGYQSIEFRPEWKHAHGIELSMTKSQRKEARNHFTDSGIEISAISPGVKFLRDDRDKQLEKMFQYIDLAADLSAPYIRFFADKLPEDPAERHESHKVQAEYQARAAAKAWDGGVTLALETHGNSIGVDTGEMMFLAGHPPAFRVNWHLSHCLRNGEDTDTAYRHIKGRVVHVHWSIPDDDIKMKAIERQFELLLYDGFSGSFSVEIIKEGDNTDRLIEHASKWKQMKAKFNV